MARASKYVAERDLTAPSGTVYKFRLRANGSTVLRRGQVGARVWNKIAPARTYTSLTFNQATFYELLKGIPAGTQPETRPGTQPETRSEVAR